MDRATYHHGDLREALLVAADRLIAEKGVGTFSLRETARAVGVDPAACYRHFRDKMAVLHALAQRGFTRLAAQMAEDLARVRSSSPERALVVLGRAYVRFAVEERSAFRVMFGPTGVDARDPTLRGTYADGEGPYDLLQSSLSKWAEHGGHRIDVDMASVTLWCAVHGLASLLIDGALRPPDDKARTRMIDDAVLTYLRGLAKKAI